MKYFAAILFIAILAITGLFIIKPKPQPSTPNFTTEQKLVYKLGDETILLPKTYKVTQVKFKDPNLFEGYCGEPGVPKSCDLLVVGNIRKPNLVLSSPLQFSVLVSDAQECFKEHKSDVYIGGQAILVTEYYHNLSEIMYKPERIDNGENPYDCTNVEVKEENFHHAKGCNSNNICVWVNKNFDIGNLKSSIVD